MLFDLLLNQHLNNIDFQDGTGKPLFVPLEKEDLEQWKKVFDRLQRLVEVQSLCYSSGYLYDYLVS